MVSNQSKNLPAIKKIPASIWVLGFVSMLTDISTEMIHSLLPMFLVSTMGASVLIVGLIEGVAESTALMMKVFSGSLSDFLGRHKTLVVAGYGLSALTKLIFPVALSIQVILGARFLDRIGKGIRDAPRDALIADITPLDVRGAAFGLRQSLDSVGAFLGPCIAVILMLVWANEFRWVFWVAIIPVTIAVILLILFVDEMKVDRPSNPQNPLSFRSLKKLDFNYWSVVLIGSMLGFARYSDAFLVLRAYDSGIPMYLVPLVLVVMNIVYALVAYPFGKLSDRVGYANLLKCGVITLLFSNLILAYGHHFGYVLMGVSLWGLHMGLTQGLMATMIADVAPEDLRGTAYGVFNLFLGVSMLVSNAISGLIWDHYGAEFTFYFSALICSLCFIFLLSNVMKFRYTPAS